MAEAADAAEGGSTVGSGGAVSTAAVVVEPPPTLWDKAVQVKHMVRALSSFSGSRRPSLKLALSSPFARGNAGKPSVPAAAPHAASNPEFGSQRSKPAQQQEEVSVQDEISRRLAEHNFRFARKAFDELRYVQALKSITVCQDHLRRASKTSNFDPEELAGELQKLKQHIDDEASCLQRGEVSPRMSVSSDSRPIWALAPSTSR